MSCEYKDRCPSATVWCEGKQADFGRCIPFLLSAYENAKGPAILYECDRRACSKCSPECHNTTDIRHAKNFEMNQFAFVERPDDG